MKKNNVPDEIVTILKRLESKEILEDAEKDMLQTFLYGLEEAIVNPACSSKILVNPIPQDPIIENPTQRSLEDRIRHINTISARIRASMMPETPEEAEDFDVPEDFDLLPKSIFEVVDHESNFVEENLTPINEVIEPNPDITPDVPVSEAPSTSA